MRKIRLLISKALSNALRYFSKGHIKLFLFLITFSFLLAYLLGVIFPIKPFQPSLTNNAISLNDLINRAIQFLAAFATFTAAIIALFRDELRRTLLENHNIYIDFSDNTNKLIESEYDAELDDKRTIRYDCDLVFENKGNVHEKSCEVFIQNIIIKDTISEKPVRHNHSALKWSARKDSKILIPVKGKVILNLFNITPEENIEETESSIEETKAGTAARSTEKFGSSRPQINSILKIQDDIEFPNQKLSNKTLTISYLVCFENNKPKEFDILVKWDGKWDNRLHEMQGNIAIELNIKSNE
jgi:hypothetical protein